MIEFLKNISDGLVIWAQQSGLKVIILLSASFIIYKFGGRAIKKIIRAAVPASGDLSPEEENRREDTLIAISVGTLKFLVALLVSLMILSEAGVNIAPLIAGAGVVGIALGFGGQYLIKDIITGLFIILENQYRVGDVVTISGISGAVESINLRVTVLRDLDGVVHHVPHGEVSTTSNMSKGFSRVNLNIGISYGADIDQVIKVVNRVGKEMQSDDNFKDKILSAPEFLRVDSFAESAIEIKILGNTKPLAQWEVAGELRRRLKTAFDQEGIEIPFPQVVVHTK